MPPILKSTKYVVDNADFVKINQEKIREFAAEFNHEKTEHWLSSAPFDFSGLTDEARLHFLFVFYSLVFCFWGKPKWMIKHEGKELGGSWSLIFALGQAIEQGIPILDFAFLSQVPKETFSSILRSNVEIPLLDERLEIVHELGSIITTRFDGKAKNIIKESDGSASKLLELIIDSFSSFKDTSFYKGQEIFFYKRAQALVADIFQAFNGKGFGDLKSLDILTACSDYKLPQILRRLGILEYVPELAERIDHKIEILHNAPEEVEIRACTVWAVELITQEVKKRDSKIMAFEVNNDLWLSTQTKSPNDKPYHLTRTTAY